MKRKTVLVLGGYDRSLLNFRGPLLRALVSTGHSVIAAAPAESADVPVELGKMGVRFVPILLDRTGLNPVADGITLLRLHALFLRERPDVVLSYTIKPVIYGSLAAAFAHVPYIYGLVEGLGVAFNTPGWKGRILKSVASGLYRLALRRCEATFVVNQDIKALFVRTKTLDSRNIVVLPGTGIDLEHFTYCPPADKAPVFLYLGRLLRDKGLAEFVLAARQVKSKIAAARFLIVGDFDANPASFSAAEVQAWECDGIIERFGFQSDVRPFLRACTAYVLPSYHEGLPRSVLEAMSTGRCIITTDAMGCREMIFGLNPCAKDGVYSGENGLMVPSRTVDPLAAAMLRVARNPAAAAQMGCRGRDIAEKVFDVRLVNQKMLQAMRLVE